MQVNGFTAPIYDTERIQFKSSSRQPPCVRLVDGQPTMKGRLTMYEKTWALVANGGMARIVTYLGDVEFRAIFDLNDGQARTTELLSDRVGRSFTSKGKSRSGIELHSDLVRNQERLFAEKLTGFLADRVKRGDIDTLLLVASPRTLGDLRRAFPNTLRRRVIQESDKDLTQLAEADLLDELVKMLGDNSG